MLIIVAIHMVQGDARARQSWPGAPGSPRQAVCSERAMNAKRAAPSEGFCAASDRPLVRGRMIGRRWEEDPTAPMNRSSGSGSNARELINGLGKRQAHDASAAFILERAAQLELNFHLPSFMLGNAACELGDLDAAVRHYERARPPAERPFNPL
jgi:hypothetical protein